MKNFNVDFVERSLNNLAQYKGDYEISNLLCCLLAFIVIPKERYCGQLSEKRITEHADWGILPQHILFGTCRKCNQSLQPEKLTLKDFVKHMRDSIAHGGMETFVENNSTDITHVQFINKINNAELFKAVIPVNNLKTLAQKLSEWYLKKAKQEKAKKLNL